jgi:hypothetical protein
MLTACNIRVDALTTILQSTDHELIPTRNASLVAMQVSASGNNVRYYPTWKHSPLKERKNKAVTMLKLPDVCNWAMNHYISLSLTSRKSSVHLHALYSPHTALRTFTPHRWTCDLWTVHSVTSQRTVIFVLTAVRTWNLIKDEFGCHRIVLTMRSCK